MNTQKKQDKNKKIIIALSAVLLAIIAGLVIFLLNQKPATVSALDKPVVILTGASATSVDVTWQSVNGATEYQVLRSLSAEEGFETVNTIDTITYTDTNLTCGTTYFYRVDAYGDNAYSASDVVSIKVVPKTVSGITYQKNEDNTAITLTWDKDDVDGYQIYCKFAPDEEWQELAIVLENQFTHEGLSPDTTVYYQIRGIKVVGEEYIYGEFSNTFAVIATPDKVDGLSFKNLCNTAKITWSEIDNVDGYEIYCKESGDKDFKLLATAQTNGFVKKNIKAGYSAEYKVRAFKNDGEAKVYGEFSDVITVVTKHKVTGSWYITKEETCATEGEKRRECEYCGAYFYQSIPIDTTIHKYKTTVISPTCIKGGYSKNVCLICEKECIFNETVAMGHIATEVDSKKATCLDTGYSQYQCSLCKIQWKEIKEPKGHSFICDVTTPSCETEGFSHYTCTVCLEEYNTDFVSPLGHDYTITQNVTSCTDSVVKNFDCNRCDASHIEIGESIGHKYEFVKTVAPTCFEDGYDLYICATCSTTCRTNTTPMLENHIFETITIDSTCQGVVQVQQCIGCGYMIYDESILLNHNFEERLNFDLENIDSLKCGDYLEMSLVCTDCNLKLVVESMMMTHNYAPNGTVAPTCTAEGYSVYKCANCDDEYRTNIVDKLKHDIVATETVAPTCLKSGYSNYKCTRCPIIYTGGFTEPTGHDYEITTVAPTCTSRGYDLEICKVCDAVGGTSNYVAKIGHDYEAKATNHPATCTQDGYYGVACLNCNEPNETTMKNVVPKLGHDISSKYTVDENGYRHYTCSRCTEGETDTTCYINIAKQTISIPDVAEFTDESGYTKLTLNPDGISNYELTGTATNLAIKVNVTFECEVKLAGVNITNTGIYGIDFDDETVDESLNSTADNEIEDNIPLVSLSAKDGTKNTITIKQSGNAIENGCELDIKGHGTLNLKSESTTIDSKGKLDIKNLTLNITSGNRGIDTKEEIYNDKGILIEEEFYNVTIQGNADVKIDSADDGIRSKKFEMSILDADEVDSTLTIVAGGDGIQAEGKKKGAIIFNSGIADIKATGTPLKSEAGSITIYDKTKVTY